MNHHPRRATEAETPRNARLLAELATLHGWRVAITYAEGSEPFGKKAGTPVTSVAVRMHRDNVRLAALWFDGKFHRCLAPFEVFNLSGAKTRISVSPAGQVAA